MRESKTTTILITIMVVSALWMIHFMPPGSPTAVDFANAWDQVYMTAAKSYPALP